MGKVSRTFAAVPTVAAFQDELHLALAEFYEAGGDSPQIELEVGGFTLSPAAKPEGRGPDPTENPNG